MDFLYLFVVGGWIEKTNTSYMLFTRICISFQQRAKLHIADYETLQKEMKDKKLAAQRISRITVMFAHLFLVCITSGICQSVIRTIPNECQY